MRTKIYHLIPGTQGSGARQALLAVAIEIVIHIVYNMVMIRTNINTLKAHLSDYLKKTQKGETILVCKRNVPIAEIVPVAKQKTIARSIGLAKGDFSVPGNFNEPLEDDEINAFLG
jgi:prevent-host-death family protein